MRRSSVALIALVLIAVVQFRVAPASAQVPPSSDLRIEAQAQAGEGGAQVVGHAGEHGGAFTPAPLQPLHHPVKAGGEAAHGRAAPGRQGKGAGLVETHLSQGQLQPPQGAVYLQGEIKQTGTQATAP